MHFCIVGSERRNVDLRIAHHVLVRLDVPGGAIGVGDGRNGQVLLDLPEQRRSPGCLGLHLSLILRLHDERLVLLSQKRGL